MSTAKRDFERFVTWLQESYVEAPPDVRRLANLALANFEALAPTSRQHSQRPTSQLFAAVEFETLNPASMAVPTAQAEQDAGQK